MLLWCTVIITVLLFLSIIISTCLYRYCLIQVQKANKFNFYFQLLSQWLTLKESGTSIESMLSVLNYKTIGIYGMGNIGRHLYAELKDSNIKVEYAIDKNTKLNIDDLDIISLEDDFMEVDAVIITVPFEFYSIEEKLSQKVKCPIISIEELIYRDL